MTERQRLHWMRDILDHLRHCHDQLPVADEASQRFLAQSMKRDLDEFRRLCDSLLSSPPIESTRPAAAAA